MSENQDTDDVLLLRDLLTSYPPGLQALYRLDTQRMQLALALKAVVTFNNLQARLTPLQVKLTKQVLSVVQKPALELADQIAERVTRAKMLEVGLDPDSSEDRSKFSRQLGDNIHISP